MLEAIAQVGALAGGRLQVDRHVQAPFVRRSTSIEGPGNPRDDPLLFALAHVGAGMDDQVGDPQQLAALDLDGHRVDRLLPEGLVGTGQVDQVRRVSHRVDDSRLGEGQSKRRDVLGRERRRVPLIVILREELNRLEPDRLSGRDRTIATAGDRHVSAEGPSACIRLAGSSGRHFHRFSTPYWIPGNGRFRLAGLVRLAEPSAAVLPAFLIEVKVADGTLLAPQHSEILQ